MKKLVFFISEDYALYSHRLNIVNAAVKAGYKVHVLCRINPGIPRPQELSPAVELCPLSHFTRGGCHPFELLRTLWEVMGWYKRLRPDLVHHVALKPCFMGTWAAFLSGVPHIINALGGLGFTFSSPRLKARLIRFLLKPAGCFLWRRKNVMLLVQNPDDASTLKNWLLQARITLIPGAGVNTQHFAPADSVARDPATIVMVSRMLRDKGVWELVEAASLLRESMDHFKIILVGTPDPQNPETLKEAELQALNGKNGVTWLGARTDIAAIYQKATIAVLPSYREGFPKTLLEAAACGCPIVTTDVPGCRDVIEDGISGLLVPPRHVAALTNALKWLLMHPDERASMGAAARARAVALFSDEKIVEATLKLYAEVMHPPRYTHS